MATRVVEWKKPYKWWKAISIDENKVISLNLRDENNLIIYDEWDDEIYVDLQLDDEITPTDAFPIWVNVGRVIVDNGWDLPWTIISAVTTSWDNIKIFYADEWTLWIDNWTGTFKQIYFKADVDALLLALRNYINWELAKKQNWVASDTAPSNPSEWDLWYDTTNSAMKVWDWTAWQSVGWWDVLVSTQANNIFTPWMKIWGWTETDYQSLTPDSNTAYLLLADTPTPWRLPTWYTELQYIDSNWQQILNSWVSLTSDYLQIQREIRYLNDVGDYNYFYNSNTQWMSMERSGDGKLSFNTASTYSLFNNVAMTQGTDYTYDITYNNWTQTLNWTSASYSWSISNKWDIYFFVWWATLGNAPSALRCYSLKLYTGNDFTLVRDFVPAVRDNDSVAWLYDVVNDVFYTSTTATDFIAWPSA